MKGDFTRVTFKSEKHYSGVRMQQGRVLLDADFNEYVDIQAHLNQIEARDVIGPCGAPQDNAGFEIGVTPDGGDLTIAPGRIYVDGILCQSEKLSVPIVAFSAAYQVQVATLTLENGQQFTTGQWIEVLVADTEPQLARIVDVNPEERILTYETWGEGELPLPAEGIEAQVRLVMTYNHQPDYPTPELVWDEETLAEIEPGIYLAYLDVWQRHITALEDAAIREVALGGPDTTTRTKTVWQVKLLRAGDGPFNCASELEAWQEATAHSSGQLRARAEPETTETDPCVVPARAGYRGLENQLYRVEVHRVVSDTEITIKWSRENGSVVARWDKQDSQDANKLTKLTKLTVSSAGRDEVLGFAPDDWIELTDDTRELHGQPGLLVQITKVDGKVLTIDPGTQTVKIGDFAPTRKVRRWDMPSETGEITVSLAETDNWIELENGIEVAFEPGIYHTGDYWLIPARTATRDIEWPRDGNVALPQSPHGIHHHYCRLALLRFDGTTWERKHDCRKLFPPLTEMVRFFYISGDGQEAMPDNPLRKPLQVGVVNGQTPVAGAKVKFRVADGNGQLQESTATPCSEFTSDGITPIEVETGSDGIASCCWRLDNSTLSQQVEATLLEIDGKPMVDGDGVPFLTPIRFNANLSIASQVHYDSEQCINPANPETVQDALDQLCRNAALYYVSGDGQEAEPGDRLPQPLQVRVANGKWPVEGAEVVFRIVEPGDGELTPASSTPKLARVPTDEYGLAQCEWRLDAVNPSQQVEAFLAGAEHLPIRFNANLDVGEGEDPGVHILDLFLNTGQQLRNDTFVTAQALARGLNIKCDRPLVRDSVRGKPVCLVTLHLPYPFNSVDREMWGDPVIGFQPLILAASVNADDNAIFWSPTKATQSWLERRLFPTMAELRRGDRILANLTLKGNFIWAVEGDATEQQLYLDGDVFGQLRPDGSGVDLILPSGDGRRGGDFEMWFWLGPKPEDPEPPSPPGEIRWFIEGVGGIASLDPVRVNDSQDKTVIDLLYAGLVRLNAELEVIPDLAQSWDVSEDASSFTFHLRGGSSFSDGWPITAADVAFSLERARDPAYGWSGPVYLSNIEKKIKVVDDFTVIIELKQPSRFFLHQLTTAPAKIVSRQAVEAGGDDWDENPVTSGPFWVPSWQRGANHIVLEQYPDYWEPASIDRIHLFFTGDRDVALRSYLRGEADVVGGLQNDVTSNILDPAILEDLAPVVSPSSGLRYLGFNTTQRPFNDDRVRRALAMAINRDLLVEVLNNSVERADRISPPGIDSLALDFDLPFDPDGAVELLEEAGFGDPSELGEVRLTFAVEGTDVLVAEFLKTMWEDLGIQVFLDGRGLREFSSLLHQTTENPAESDVHIYYSFWGADYPDPQNVLSQQLRTIKDVKDASHANNNGHYSNPDFDGLVDAADRRTTVSWQVYRRAELLAMGDVAWFPLFYPRPRVLIRKGLEGLVVTGQGIIIPSYGALTSTDE